MKDKIVMVLLAVFFSARCNAESVVPTEIFAKLKTLVGNWEGKNDRGRLIKVSYRVAASDSILMESWTLSPERNSLTIYHMDGGALMATHYCPLGNQPRLRFKPEAAGRNKYAFEFFDATNLADRNIAHEHQFEVSLVDASTFVRSETYLENNEGKPSAITFHRVD